MEFHPMQCAARRTIVPVVTIALGLLLSAVAPAPDNPARAIAAAAGHSAARHLSAETTVVRDGATKRDTLDVAGPQRLERTCLGDVCHGSWFDGKQSFDFGINTTPFRERERDERAQRTFVAIASTAFAEPDFIAGGGRVTALPDVGDGHVRYRVTALGGSDLVAVADARTGRLETVERPDRSVYAALVASGTAPALVYAPRGYDRVAIVNVPLEAPRAPHVSVGQTREISLLSGDLPIVPCRLAGRSATCLIDTGTSPSAVTLAFAERLEREPHGSIEIAGLGDYLTGIIDAGPLEIGAATFAALRFAVIPHARGADFDVIVGSDALTGLAIDLEPGRRRVAIAAGGAALAGNPIGLDFVSGLPYADVRLGGRDAPQSLLVDTGDSGTISIGYDAYRQDTGLFAVRERTVASGVGSAAMDGLRGELSAVDTGAIHFENVAVTAVRGQHQGHLGYGFAARCGRLTLDLGASRIACGTAAGLPLPR